MDHSQTPPVTSESMTAGYQNGDGSIKQKSTKQQAVKPPSFDDDGDYSHLIMGTSSSQRTEFCGGWDRFNLRENFDSMPEYAPQNSSEDRFDFSEFVHDDFDESSHQSLEDGSARQPDGLVEIEQHSDAVHLQEQESYAQTTQHHINAPLSCWPASFNQEANDWPCQSNGAPKLQYMTILPAVPQVFVGYSPIPSNAAGGPPIMDHAVQRPTEWQQLHPEIQLPPLTIAPQVQVQHPFSVALEVHSDHPSPRRREAGSDFPDLQASMRHPVSGLDCEGTYRQLLHQYPELRPGIQAEWSAWEKGEAHQSPIRQHKRSRKNAPMVKLSSERNSTRQRRNPHTNSGRSRIQQLIDATAGSPTESYASTPLSSVCSFPLQLIDNDHFVDAARSQVRDADFDLEHESIDAALEYLERPPAEVCEELEIEGDDWEDFADFSNQFKLHCQHLFDALRQPGGAVPDRYDQEQKIDYKAKNALVRTQILDSMQTPEQIRTVKARVIKAMSMVVRVHEVGVPRATMHATKKARGYSIDKQSSCKQRVQKVISAARISKYVARDIIKSENLTQIALSPDEYLKKKFTNSDGNKNKGVRLKAATAAKRNSTAAAEVGEASDSDAIRESAASSAVRSAV